MPTAALTLAVASPAAGAVGGPVHQSPLPIPNTYARHYLYGTGPAPNAVTRHGSSATGTVRPIPASAGHIDTRSVAAPMPTSQCLAQLGHACYSPAQLRTAYGLNGVYAHGLTGAGQSVCIVDALGSPTLQHDFDTFNTQWGLPPQTLDIRYPEGKPAPYDVNNPDFPGWAGEATLDVDAAHYIAPGAHIVVAVTPVSETEGVEGFPEIMDAIKTLVDHGTCGVISMSFGSTENDFPGFDQGDFSSLLDLRGAFADARAHHVTLEAAAGDVGSAGIASNGQDLLANPAVSWPGSDPDVVSAGGTQLHLDDAGVRLTPDVVWNDRWGAAGGGLSAIFPRPAFQNRVEAVAGDHRAMPDLSFSSAVDGGLWVYYSYPTPDNSAGWHVFGGTSAATPSLAAVTALAEQRAGHRLGNLDNALYRLAGRDGYTARSGLVDVTSGTNTLTGSGVPGYDATAGYDLASGLGTFDAYRLINALGRG